VGIAVSRGTEVPSWLIVLISGLFAFVLKLFKLAGFIVGVAHHCGSYLSKMLYQFRLCFLQSMLPARINRFNPAVISSS